MGVPPLYVQGLTIPKNTKNPAAAVALARWVTSAENQAAFSHLTSVFPSTKASANDPFFSKSDGTNAGDAKVVAFDSLAKAKLIQPVQVDDAMSTIVNQQIALAISGDASLQAGAGLRRRTVQQAAQGLTARRHPDRTGQAAGHPRPPHPGMTRTTPRKATA